MDPDGSQSYARTNTTAALTFCHITIDPMIDVPLKFEVHISSGSCFIVAGKSIIDLTSGYRERPLKMDIRF